MPSTEGAKSYGSVSSLLQTPTQTKEDFSVASPDREQDTAIRTKDSPRTVLLNSSTDDNSIVSQVRERQVAEGMISRIDMMAACFSTTACVGGGATSAAYCNNETLSPSFLVLDGIESISLGKVASNERTGDRVLKEATERWKNRVESRICVGNVSYEYRRAEEKFAITGDDAKPQMDEELLGPALNLVKAGSRVSQSLGRKTLPRATSLAMAAIKEKASGVINPDRYLPPIHSMVADHLRHQEYDEALRLFEEILQGNRSLYGDKDLIVSVAMHNKAVVYLLAGERDEALYNFHEAVLTKKEGLKADDPLIADSLVEVGILLFAQGELERSLAVFEEALETYGKDYFVKEDTGASRILNNMGCVHFEMGKPGSAIGFLQKALAIQHMSLGSTPNAESALLSLSITQSNIGHIKLAYGNYDDALVVLEEALLVQQSVFGDENETVKNTIQNIATCKAAARHKRQSKNEN